MADAVDAAAVALKDLAEQDTSGHTLAQDALLYVVEHEAIGHEHLHIGAGHSATKHAYIALGVTSGTPFESFSA